MILRLESGLQSLMKINVCRDYTPVALWGEMLLMVRDMPVTFPSRNADAVGPDAARTEGRNTGNDKAKRD